MGSAGTRRVDAVSNVIPFPDAEPERCEICDTAGDLETLRGVRAHLACFPTHWTKGNRGRNRKWDVGYKAAKE